MKHKGSVIQFIKSPSARGTMWCRDSVTNDVVTTCESCSAEARHSKDDLNNFSFQHETMCPFDVTSEHATNMMNKSRTARGCDLAARVGSILEQETDASLVVTTLSVLSVLACEAAAENAGVELAKVGEQFVRNFERALSTAALTKETSWEIRRNLVANPLKMN
jgi:hydroxyethylthiazole kinase-like sugar kinase family protein